MSTELTDGLGRKMLDAKQVSELIGCHERHIRRLADNGKMPPPLKIGKLSRWSVKAINDWVDAGCPEQSGAVQ